jgi:hypothetical protein
MSPITFLVLRYFGYISEDLIVGWATKHRKDPVQEARLLWRKVKIFYYIAAAGLVFMVLLNIGVYRWGSIDDGRSIAFFLLGNAALGTIVIWFPLKASLETFYEFSMNGFGKDINALLEELNISSRKLRSKNVKDLKSLATTAIVARVHAILLIQDKGQDAPPLDEFGDSSLVETRVANSRLKRTYDTCANFCLNEWKGYGEYFALAKA